MSAIDAVEKAALNGKPPALEARGAWRQSIGWAAEEKTGVLAPSLFRKPFRRQGRSFAL